MMPSTTSSSSGSVNANSMISAPDCARTNRLSDRISAAIPPPTTLQKLAAHTPGAVRGCLQAKRPPLDGFRSPSSVEAETRYYETRSAGTRDTPPQPPPSQTLQRRHTARPTLRWSVPVSYTHLRAHETPEHLVCRLLLEK